MVFFMPRDHLRPIETAVRSVGLFKDNMGRKGHVKKTGKVICMICFMSRDHLRPIETSVRSLRLFRGQHWGDGEGDLLKIKEKFDWPYVT
jgi:hypothetical protein